MATLTSAQLTALRNAAERNLTVHYTKAQVGAALQAIDDQMQLAATRTAIGNAIEAAAPGAFSVAEKTTLFALWSLTFARRQGVL